MKYETVSVYYHGADDGDNKLRLSPLKAAIFILMGLASVAADAAVKAGTGVGFGTTGSWASHGGTLDGIHYSELNDINSGNASSLIEEFSFPTNINGSHMGAPLVVGSTLYAVTPFPNNLVAYDLNTGALKWTFTPKIRGYAFGVNCCDTVNRGASFATHSKYPNGLIVFNTLDNTTVAVDAGTGLQVWQTVLADPTTGVTTNGATLVVPDKSRAGESLVVMGSSSGEMAVRGWVKALDLATGSLRWTAYTTGSDADVKINPATYKPFYSKDAAGDQGISSWQGGGDKWQQGGSSVWGYITYDADTDLLFYGTSQPGVWNADQRPGDNKWGASLFARKASTGEAQWIYQVTPHDQWDYDAVSESLPIDLASPITTASGSHGKVLMHFNKNGFAYMFDRQTGEVLSAPIFGPNDASVNWASSIDLKTGLPLPPLITSKATTEGNITQNICPSAMGMKGWEPSAYSPRTNTIYLPVFNLCMSYQGLKTEYIAGAPYMGTDIGILPGTASWTFDQGAFHMGELVAWDMSTNSRKTGWSIPEVSPIYGGVLATAGDVVFYATLDNKFKAVDATTGTSLWSTALECSSVGSPISFVSPKDNKQRIAIFSGVSWLAGGFTSTGKPCPGKGGSTVVSGGGRVHVYKLP